jgi:hypothetical protein
MPVTSVAAAREWKAQNVRPQLVVGAVPQEAVETPIAAVTYNIAEARARREHHEANIAAMRESQLAESLVSIERVRLALTTLAAEVRNAFERLPDKLSDPLAAETSADVVHAMLTGAVGEVLQDLSRSVADLDLSESADGRH